MYFPLRHFLRNLLLDIVDLQDCCLDLTYFNNLPNQHNMTLYDKGSVDWKKKIYGNGEYVKKITNKISNYWNMSTLHAKMSIFYNLSYVFYTG